MAFRKMAMWTGIALTGMCGIVLLGGGKVQSGALLIITAFVMTLLVGRNKLPVWLRVVLLCAVFGLVIANISTTQLPTRSDGMAMSSKRGRRLQLDRDRVPGPGDPHLQQLRGPGCAVLARRRAIGISAQSERGP